MILVQNHQRLLNGNNFLALLVIIFGITSCGAKKITSTQRIEVVEINAKSNQLNFNSAEEKKRYDDSIAKNATVFDLDVPTKIESIKDSIKVIYDGLPKVLNNDPNRIHNIAVIVPFNLDQIPLGQYVDDSTKQLAIDSKNAVEFYLGCQMARQKFKSSQLKTNVYFLDDKNDSLTFNKLFNQKPFPNVDYVVGPIGYKNLKLAADLAKTNQISLISPFANSMYIKENAYYYNANASLKTQYSFIIDYIKTNFPSATLEVIFDGKDSTAESINILKNMSSETLGDLQVKYVSLKSTDDVTKSMIQADTLSKRFVLIYSSKDVYIKSIIAKLKSIKNDLQIFTSSCIKNTKALADIKYPHDIYTVYPYKTDNVNNSVFSDQFEEKYKKKPTEIAFQAYDLMMHLFNMMDKNQSIFDNTYNNSIDFDNTSTKYQFKQVTNKAGNIDYYDNSFMYLYKYQSGNFVAVSVK